MDTNFDVIIVGGGPSGATAAYRLGLSGVNTLLIDKHKFPRDKACGGGINIRILKRFKYLKHLLSNIPINYINRVHLESPNGSYVDYESKEPLYLMIKRIDFDNVLLNLAKENINVLEGESVKKLFIFNDSVNVILKNGAKYTCKILIGADGANSIVAKLSGLGTENLRKNYALDIMEESPYELLNVINKNTIYVYYGVFGNYGYGYVFPKTDMINYGMGYKLDHYFNSNNGGNYKNLMLFFEKLNRAKIVTGHSNKKNVKSSLIPVNGPLKKTYKDRIMLCGDAGGFVNAFTAEGIYYGMVSGDYAAQTAILAIKKNNFAKIQLKQYEHLWNNEIGLELRESVKIQKTLLSNTSRIDTIVKMAKSNRQFADLLVRHLRWSPIIEQCDKV
jgi:geranylgeranyl reductase family protein